MKGWHNQGWRHSLAARGITTSFYSKDPRRLERKYLKPEERGAQSFGKNVFEVRPGGVYKSKKAMLMSEEEYIEDVLNDPKSDISDDRRKELGAQLANIKEMKRHITGRPPTRYVRASEDIREGLYDRLKGTSGRVPEVIKEDVLGGVDLGMTEEERIARYERIKRESMDERAKERAIEGMEMEVLSLEPEDLDETDLINQDIMIKDRRRIKYAGIEHERMA